VSYLAVSIGVTILAVRWAKNRGRRPWVWGGLVALIMYHLVFWDYLPTLITFKYLVHTRSGFWVYKTPEQWKVENPRVVETLTWSNNRTDYYDYPNARIGFKLNERIAWITIDNRTSVVPVNAKENIIIDVDNNDILVRTVFISSGYLNGQQQFKFWTVHHQLPSQKNKKKIIEIKKEYRELGEEIK
jgi:hypothetical protein